MDRHTLSSSAHAALKKYILPLAAFAALYQPAHSSEHLHSHLDLDMLRERFDATGEGVLIAFIDQGIDWNNEDFRNDDGTTRIEYLYDLTDDSGKDDDDNAFNKGTVYSRAEIDAAIDADQELGFSDANGRATAIAGIAVGNGRNADAADFSGIAPNASIIAVKAYTDGAPAHGSTPAVARSYNPTLLPIAVDFVAAKAEELGMPAVVLVNYHRQGGPTDGTSLLNRKIDAYAQANSGLVFVTGTGNSGGIDSRASGTLAPGETVTMQIEKNNPDLLEFDLWYPATLSEGVFQLPLKVSVKAPNGVVHGPYTPGSSEGFINDVLDKSSVFTLHHRSEGFDFYGSSASLRQLWVRLTGVAGQYDIILELPDTATESVAFQASLSATNQGTTEPSHFLTHAAVGNLWDGAASEQAIVVTGYATESTWVDIDGTAQSDGVELGEADALAIQSSIGPTFDGRFTTDIAAPAGSFFSTYDPDSYLASIRANLIQSGGGAYGRIEGTDAAAASVAGLVALMLEQDRNLYAADVEQQLAAAAVGDAITGATPNDNWGSGRLGAEESVFLAYRSGQSGFPVAISGFESPSSPIMLQYEATSEFSYKIQYRTSLEEGEWIDLNTFTAGDGTVKTVDPGRTPQQIDGTIFYRAVFQ